MTLTDPRFPAVALILDTLGPQWRKHIVQGGIDFPTMLDQLGYTGSERLRIECAWGLWNGGAQVSLDDLAFGLDARNHATVLAAIAMCRLSVNRSMHLPATRALELVGGELTA